MERRVNIVKHNNVYSYDGTGMQAEVILASKPKNGAPPIITVRTRHPRVIHGEILTHRVFSRNARSSRAVPVNTMLEEVRNEPFVPWHWGKNQRGMQAGEECSELISLPTASGGCEDLSREDAWLRARDWAVTAAEGYMNSGYHKQIANRLIEPFSYIDTLITSSNWNNFYHLRDHKDAEPHFKDLAMLVKKAIKSSKYHLLKDDWWHLPYITKQDRYDVRHIVGSGAGSTEKFWDILRKISTARCARISYAPFDGEGSIEREIERHDLLVGSEPLHASPTEHQATSDEIIMGPSAPGLRDLVPIGFKNPHLGGNLGAGWIQYRKTLPNEFIV